MTSSQAELVERATQEFARSTDDEYRRKIHYLCVQLRNSARAEDHDYLAGTLTALIRPRA